MSTGDLATTGGDAKRTEVGSVFVSNYPPYSVWKAGTIEPAERAIDAEPVPGTSLGLYLHVPFCRKRCKFCYFKVYTDRNSAEVARYLDHLAREVELYAERAATRGRRLTYVYVGGGTPSFLSSAQLRGLANRVKAALPWRDADEVTFECEPGTLTRSKLDTIRDIGVTRLSLGIENWNDAILAENGRAHLSHEVERVLPWIREVGFDQLNVDLIAGMVGETWETWRESVQRTIDVAPESITIYQMELPYNTVYSQSVLGGRQVPVADWDLKRAWHAWAIDALEGAGYGVSSAYTMVRQDRAARFVYRDSVWHGGDLLGTGVASFSHVGGVHFQNVSGWDPYGEHLAAGRLPIERTHVTTERERLTRELVLQLKLGRVDARYFADKFGVEITEIFRPALERLEERRMLRVEASEIRLTRDGLLRVDSLLPEFYDERFRGARYT